MNICLKENEFNPSLLYQSWCDEEKAKSMGYTIVEIDDKYIDCAFEDFENFVFKPEKYEQRKLNEENIKKIPVLQTRLDQLTQDFIQVLCGAVIDDIEERKREFQALHNELRNIQRKEPRIYE